MCVLEGKDRMYFGGGRVSPDYEIILGKNPILWDF